MLSIYFDRPKRAAHTNARHDYIRNSLNLRNRNIIKVPLRYYNIISTSPIQINIIIVACRRELEHDNNIDATQQHVLAHSKHDLLYFTPPLAEVKVDRNVLCHCALLLRENYTVTMHRQRCLYIYIFFFLSSKNRLFRHRKATRSLRWGEGEKKTKRESQSP